MYKSATEISPSMPSFTHLASVYFHLNEFEKVEETCGRALEYLSAELDRDTWHPIVLYRRAKARNRLGKTNFWLEDAKMVVKRWPNSSKEPSARKLIQELDANSLESNPILYENDENDL